MEEVTTGFAGEISSLYASIISPLPETAKTFVNLFFLVVLVVLYAVFIWKFYKFVSKKDFLGLNLKKYNKTENPFLTKLFAGVLYFFEYIIVLPFLIFFWFLVFTIFIILLTGEAQTTQNLLVITAIVIAAIRITSFYKKDLAEDLAKTIPFTLLAVSISTSGFFNIQRIFIRLSEIPTFMVNIIYYLGFIIIIEIILRFFDFLISLFGLEEENSED